MPESRDRLVRPVDLAAEFIARRRSGALGTLRDERDRSSPPLESPIQQRTPGFVLGRGTARAGGWLATPRTPSARGRTLHGSPFTRAENTPTTSRSAMGGLGRGRSTSSILPSWYPRTPLRDITYITRAMERRRARLADAQAHETDSPPLRGPRTLNPTLQLLHAPLEHEHSLVTPSQSVGKKRCPPSVGNMSKILLKITNKSVASDDSEFLTPQKKLLNQIETVEKEVMDELKKLKRTPSARKAERERKVRTLLSMR
ncbi:protein POLYCHOME [Punica granatum]|uniref:Uncharacterized protein n=2 Tax=Punica granatum TaxID=22663 RepID=A0A218W3I8_PUNGR|nr:protein POLYCHOME [Punica granatum]XP_031395664.1 protein POLYCHOME [Punica granatum]OWM67196.1 hypothetical protein CDL15_Pgr000648 [Punica granatum]PKI72202.1 hypothetical protein CRG98_007400 [Punica granatum]